MNCWNLLKGGSILETLLKINNIINEFIWGPPVLILLLGTGLFLAIRTKFIIYRRFGFIGKNTFGKIFDKKEASEGSVTPFQAVSTALGGTVGTGNIAGVATAISLGGPGAVFWMWLAAIIGMTTKFAEITLAVATREKNEKGEWAGGPMYYIKNGLKIPWLSKIFSFLGCLAPLGVGAMVQSNSISDALNASFYIPTWITGIVIGILAFIVIVGGIKRIGQFAEKVVPFMAVVYIIGGIIILIIERNQISVALRAIFTDAFTGTAATGGFAGSTVAMAIRWGVARGIFTNEAGLGTAPIAHSASDIDHPVRQGIWGAFEVFMDTILVCSITALVILTSGLWTDPELKGASLTTAAFNSAFAGGGYIIAVGIALFAFTTLIGWSYYGEKCFEFFVGSNKLTIPYRILYIVLSFIGSIGGLSMVWGIADTLNGLMAIPNLIGILGLSGVVVKLTKDFFKDPDRIRSKDKDWSEFFRNKE